MRQPKPFFRKQTQSWWVQLGKKQHNLGKDEKAAMEQYHALMIGRQEASPTMPIADLFGLFLDWTKRNRAERTHKWYKGHLDSFENHAGARLQVRDLKGYHVERWLSDSYSTRGDTHKNGAVRALSRAFNWGRKQGYLDRNPIADVERSAYQPREAYIKPADWKRIVATVKAEPFLDLITFM